jgi:hypothetical protein
MKREELVKLIREEIRAALREDINPYAVVSHTIPIVAKASIPTPPIAKSQLVKMITPIVQEFAFITSQQLANCVFYGTKLQMERLTGKLKIRGLMPYFNEPKRVPGMDAFAVDTVKDMVKPD